MLDQIPNDKSLVVVASYRTGSTALCDLLAKKHNIKNFDEVYHNCFPWRTQEFNFWQKKNHKSIIKIMPDQMPKFSVQKKIFADAFLIGLYRRDVIAQIASYYVACTTMSWHNNATDDYYVDINLEELENHCRFIKRSNGAYQQVFKNLCNIEIAYEDIADQLNESSFRTYHRPLNYNEIVARVQELYDI